jgi:hypothetical protein
VFSLLESRFNGIKKCITFCLVNHLFLLKVGGPLFNLLPQIVSLLLEKISLLHVDHQFLDIHFEGKPIVSVKRIEEILTKIPSVPGNDGATFVSPLCAEVQLIASRALQEENARDSGSTIG